MAHRDSKRNRPSRGWRRSVLVGATCFALGSVALVRADTVPPGRRNAIVDASNDALAARVNDAGELAAIDQGARARLDTLNAKLAPLAFDGDGSLKVATQGTSQITGTVAVSNFPATQQVAGTVNVGNLPATQNVDGSVAVTNFPAVQQVQGAVEVANLPATQNVAGTVAVSNLPSTQNVTGTVNVANLPAVQNVAGNVNVANFPATQDVNITGGTINTTPQATNRTLASAEDAELPGVSDGWPNGSVTRILAPDPRDPSAPFEDHDVTLIAISTNHNLRIKCYSVDDPGQSDGGHQVGKPRLVFSTSSNMIQEFSHPLKVGYCYANCFDDDDCTFTYSIAGF